MYLYLAMALPRYPSEPVPLGTATYMPGKSCDRICLFNTGQPSLIFRLTRSRPSMRFRILSVRDARASGFEIQQESLGSHDVPSRDSQGTPPMSRSHKRRIILRFRPQGAGAGGRAPARAAAGGVYVSGREASRHIRHLRPKEIAESGG